MTDSKRSRCHRTSQRRQAARSRASKAGGRLHVVEVVTEVVTEPAQIAKVLHGHVARGPPPQLLGQLELDFAV